MPCNAVATVRARVAQDRLLAAIPAALLAPIIRDYVQRAYPTVPVTILPAPAQQCLLRLGSSLTVAVEGGEITVTGLPGGNPIIATMLRTLPTALSDLLTKAGGVLWQQQIRAALAMRYGTADELMTPDGALILHLEL